MHILVDRFCASHENLPAWMCEGSAKNTSIVSFGRNKGAMRLTDAFETAESHEVAVKPSSEGKPSEGFANGAE